MIELEGAQNLRILLYEEAAERPLLRAKCTHKVRHCNFGIYFVE